MFKCFRLNIFDKNKSVFMTVYMFPFFWKLLLWVYLATSVVLDSNLHEAKDKI